MIEEGKPFGRLGLSNGGFMLAVYTKCGNRNRKMKSGMEFVRDG